MSESESDVTLLDKYGPLDRIVRAWIYMQLSITPLDVNIAKILSDNNIIWNSDGITVPNELLSYIILQGETNLAFKTFRIRY